MKIKNPANTPVKIEGELPELSVMCLICSDVIATAESIAIAQKERWRHHAIHKRTSNLSKGIERKKPADSPVKIEGEIPELSVTCLVCSREIATAKTTAIAEQERWRHHAIHRRIWDRT